MKVLSYVKFCCYVINTLGDYLPKAYAKKSVFIDHDNLGIFDGTETEFVPVFDMRRLYGDYLNGQDIDSIVESIAKARIAIRKLERDKRDELLQHLEQRQHFAMSEHENASNQRCEG